MNGEIDNVFNNIMVYCGFSLYLPLTLQLIFDRAGIRGILGNLTIWIRQVRLPISSVSFLMQSYSGIAYESSVLLVDVY